MTDTTTAPSALDDKRAFLQRYWTALTSGDIDGFAPLVDERCVVHYPGSHFLSGDHVGREAILDLYRRLYRIGIEPGTFIGELHDVTTSDDHACALITYTLVLGGGQQLTGEAVGVFHIENGAMVEYWLLERDQKLINDVFSIAGRPALARAGRLAQAASVLRHPLAGVRIARRLIRRRRSTSTRML